jgi:hypothetical protein
MYSLSIAKNERNLRFRTKLLEANWIRGTLQAWQIWEMGNAKVMSVR